MRLWLLSHLKGSPGNNRALAAAARAGIAMDLVDPERLAIGLPGGPDGPVLFDGSAPAALPDGVLTRLGASAPEAAFGVLRHLEAVGVPCVNPSSALAISRDKARTFEVLTRHGIAVPDTVVLGAGAVLSPAIDALGPPPWIVKLPVSTQGMGVAIVDSLASLRTIVDVLRGLDQRVLIQRFIAASAGTDIRVLVIAGRAVAAVRRRGQEGEVRSNVHRGGRAEAHELTPALATIAEAAAGAIGLSIAGVDLLIGDDGPVVCEVNGSPGLEGPEGATGRDYAAEVIAHVAAMVKASGRAPGRPSPA